MKSPFIVNLRNVAISMNSKYFGEMKDKHFSFECPQLSRSECMTHDHWSVHWSLISQSKNSAGRHLTYKDFSLLDTQEMKGSYCGLISDRITDSHDVFIDLYQNDKFQIDRDLRQEGGGQSPWRSRRLTGSVSLSSAPAGLASSTCGGVWAAAGVSPSRSARKASINWTLLFLAKHFP